MRPRFMYANYNNEHHSTKNGNRKLTIYKKDDVKSMDI